MERPNAIDFDWLDREIDEVLTDYETAFPVSSEQTPVLKARSTQSSQQPSSFRGQIFGNVVFRD